MENDKTIRKATAQRVLRKQREDLVKESRIRFVLTLLSILVPIILGQHYYAQKQLGKVELLITVLQEHRERLDKNDIRTEAIIIITQTMKDLKEAVDKYENSNQEDHAELKKKINRLEDRLNQMLQSNLRELKEENSKINITRGDEWVNPLTCMLDENYVKKRKQFIKDNFRGIDPDEVRFY